MKLPPNGFRTHAAARRALIRALDAVRGKRHTADLVHSLWFPLECIKLAAARANRRFFGAPTRRRIPNQLLQMLSAHQRYMACHLRQLDRPPRAAGSKHRA